MKARYVLFSIVWQVMFTVDIVDTITAAAATTDTFGNATITAATAIIAAFTSTTKYFFGTSRSLKRK